MITKEYDNYLANIQAQRIYKKILKLHEHVNKYPDLIMIEEILKDVSNIRESFDFFCDIIHLMDNPELDVIDPNRS